MMGLPDPPSSDSVVERAQTILSFGPLAVVLTGGDPLQSRWLNLAIEQLSGRAGLIVDTNGVGLTDEHVGLFQRNGVAVRISMDSEMSVVNARLRPSNCGESSAAVALDAICRCTAAGLPVTVQTVATVFNVSDLPFLGDKLFRLGVRHWRILQVAPSVGSSEGYRIASGSDRTARSLPFDRAWSTLRTRKLPPRVRSWASGMAVTTVGRKSPNAVILVGPDGVFYTESDLLVGKTLIDPGSPCTPALDSIHLRVDMLSHIKRYLGAMRAEDA
jgi:molybdenum cofactor biosynthesis enzyme MoaA